LILIIVFKSWIGLVSKNYEIECAIVELEKELVELKRKKAASNVVTVQASETIENVDNTENAPSTNIETQENKIEESN
jgi:hypothetical protein